MQNLPPPCIAQTGSAGFRQAWETPLYIYEVYMKYRLIATDMDGTLLTPDNLITDITLTRIKEAQEKGVVFTLSTGRPLQGVKRYVDMLGLDCPIITYNGAVIAHSKTGEILFSRNMDRPDARRVYSLAKKLDIMFILWSQNKLYASEISEKTAFYEGITSTKAELLTDFEAVLARGITKFLWYDSPEKLDLLIEELKKEGLDNTTFTKSRPYFLEFFSNKVSKAVAMEKLGRYYGIDSSRMIAVGDQTNDLPMIEFAGLGVAMANAVDSVKAAADYITAANTENGVAQVIEKFILQEIK